MTLLRVPRPVQCLTAALFVGLLLGLLDGRDPAHADVRTVSYDAFQIAGASDAATPSGSNPLLVEGIAVDDPDGNVDLVQVAFDDADTWVPAEMGDDQTWSYLWTSATPGDHRIRARAVSAAGEEVAQRTVEVQVRDAADTPYVISNPYAAPGTYRKGQLHTHSTNSFDGWESLPPAQLALEYKRRGYQFVSITDHDVISHESEVEDRTFITIPGYESTADSGHINGFWTDTSVSPQLAPQDRINFITGANGLAILNHPSYTIGWTGADLTSLRNYFAVEIFNAIATSPMRVERDVMLWHQALNAKGWPNRIWGVAVDDAHRPDQIDRGWVMVKSDQLTGSAIRRALENGAFYASNGPSFSALGVVNGTITASSPDAASIRFIDQDRQILRQGPAAGAGYRPTGKERWIRAEAVAADGRTAWSQPFWLLPNAPKATLSENTVSGVTVPGARVHISDHGEYLGNTVADGDGAFSYVCPALDSGTLHELWIIATARWPDDLESPPTLINPS